jgi:hypothetical protein
MEMRTVALTVCFVFVASAAWAAPRGTGNFRRAAAIKAADAQHKYTTVRGLASMAPRKNPTNARLLFVENGATKKVTIVKAPINKSQKVKVLTTKEVNKLGLITQSQARALASKNDGTYGTRGRVNLKQRGITYDGVSYQFKQTSPLGWTIPLYKMSDGTQVKGRVKFVSRTVPVTGQQGESASGWAERIK